jgi:hypothetical protein
MLKAQKVCKNVPKDEGINEKSSNGVHNNEPARLFVHFKTVVQKF